MCQDEHADYDIDEQLDYSDITIQCPLGATSLFGRFWNFPGILPSFPMLPRGGKPDFCPDFCSSFFASESVLTGGSK
jgi:hypothetical protein